MHASQGPRIGRAVSPSGGVARPSRRLENAVFSMRTFRPHLLSGLTLTASLGFATSAAVAQQVAPAPPQADPFAVNEDDFFLLQEPQTPEEFFKGAVQAQKLGRPNLARLYLQQFLQLNPDDATLLTLRDDYGPGAFARLANQPELQPVSTQLAERVNRVFRERGASPERVNQLLDDLSGTSDKAFAARQALINAGDAVVPAVIQRLQSTNDQELRRQLMEILVAMGEPVLPALHAALVGPGDDLRVQMIAVVGRIGATSSIPQLYFPAYGPDQQVAVATAARNALASIAQQSRVSANRVQPADAAEQLRQAALRSVEGRQPGRESSAEATASDVRVWSWDEAQGTVRSALMPPRQAALFEGTRFARQAFLLGPSHPDSQALYLAFLLAFEAAQAGTAEPPAGPGTAFELAVAAGPETASRILTLALRHNMPRAAVGALAVLAKTGSANLLFGGDLPLTEALNYPDPRVQLGAAVTVLRLNPDRQFRDANRVVEILARALSSSEVPTAVIIEPSVQRGSTIAGFTRDMGYDAVLAPTGQAGFSVASEETIPAFVLVNLNVSRWPLSQTIANLRSDTRTLHLPIVVYGPPEGDWSVSGILGSRNSYFRGPRVDDPRAEVTASLADTPATAYITQTTTSGAFATQLRPVLAALSMTPLSPAERVEQRAVAAYWLAQIADTGRTDVFPLQRAESALISALPEPNLAENALIALSAIPTAVAQRAIAEVVLMPNADPSVRVRAANELANHVRRNGLTVPDETVAALNRVWSSTTEPALRSALSTWGGTLRPGVATLRQRLEAVPQPVLPPSTP